jgi:hypothetical protein
MQGIFGRHRQCNFGTIGMVIALIYSIQQRQHAGLFCAETVCLKLNSM